MPIKRAFKKVGQQCDSYLGLGFVLVTRLDRPAAAQHRAEIRKPQRASVSKSEMARRSRIGRAPQCAEFEKQRSH
jgi:hypothetical protein